MMDRILFIVPPHIKFDDFTNPAYNVRRIQKKNGSYGSVLTDMPLGVLSLSAYVKKFSALETKLIDFNIVLNKSDSFEFSSFADFFRSYLSANIWLDYTPSIIAISALFTPSYQSMLDIARSCRDIFPAAIIVAGGGVPTNMYKEIFRDSVCFDGLCYGEGEKPLLGLIQADDKLQYLESNPSWITPIKDRNGDTFKQDYIENLDEVPFCDYAICQTQEYGQNPAITAYASIEEKDHNFYVMTSRGCPHRCCFCSSHTVHGRKMRYYSINRIREDFNRLKGLYAVKTIVFQDDHIMADKERFLKIIGIVKELGITAVFQNGLALYALDREILQALKNANVNQLLLSVESGSDRVLREIMHKPLDLSIVKRVACDCRQLGIYTNVNILIGLPGETKDDIEETRQFLRTLNANWFLIFCASPLVGSEMLDICLKKNYLRGSYIDCDYKKAVIETEDFTAQYIQEKAYSLNLELNFVKNSDLRLGNYKMAMKGFGNTMRVRNDHGFAFYFAAICCKKIGMDEKYRAYKEKYQEIIKESEFWKNYAEQFKLTALE